MENPQSIGGTNIYQPYQDGAIPYNQPGASRAGLYIDKQKETNKALREKENAAARGGPKSNNTNSAYLDTRGVYCECCCCCLYCDGCHCCKAFVKDCLQPCCHHVVECCKCIKESPLCKCIGRICEAVGK